MKCLAMSLYILACFSYDSEPVTLKNHCFSLPDGFPGIEFYGKTSNISHSTRSILKHNLKWCRF